MAKPGTDDAQPASHSDRNENRSDYVYDADDATPLESPPDSEANDSKIHDSECKDQGLNRKSKL